NRRALPAANDPWQPSRRVNGAECTGWAANVRKERVGAQRRLSGREESGRRAKHGTARAPACLRARLGHWAAGPELARVASGKRPMANLQASEWRGVYGLSGEPAKGQIGASRQISGPEEIG